MSAIAIDEFTACLKKQGGLIDKFDMDLWSSLVDYATVYPRRILCSHSSMERILKHNRIMGERAGGNLILSNIFIAFPSRLCYHNNIKRTADERLARIINYLK